MGFAVELASNVISCNSPCVYVTAPTTPNAYLECYYSAPVSPVMSKNFDAGNDDFEFETSKKFSGPLIRSFDETTDHEEEEGGEEVVFPSMAFADELFFNGLVMPLKLPPRLQYDGDSSHTSFSSSPNYYYKSPRTAACRIPFGRHKNAAWNDDFDPFVVAMQKVSEEKKGRSGGGRRHMRSRSYSPFRSDTNSNSTTVSCDEDQENKPKMVISPSSSFSGPLDFKGSAYARWVRDQAKELHVAANHSPKPAGFLFGRRRVMSPEKIEEHQKKKTDSTLIQAADEGITKVQKLKGLILRYASFGKEKSGGNKKITSAEAQKTSYFSRLSFKFKGNGNGKKRIQPAAAADLKKKMTMVEYKPTISLCFG